MGRVIVLEETTKNPITLMGKRAGICWGSDITDDGLNYKRGMNCIVSNHGRVMEFVNVEMVLEGYSARVIREWYTHIGGAPTRLQASTRYINYENFDYVIPESIRGNKKAESDYKRHMMDTTYLLETLVAHGVPKEDAAMVLPLGMSTKVVDKRNLRNLVDMSRQRMCTRAYWEFRELFHDVSMELSGLSEEWDWIVKNLFKPKCEDLGYCPEVPHGCGRMKKKGESEE